MSELHVVSLRPLRQTYVGPPVVWRGDDRVDEFVAGFIGFAGRVKRVAPIPISRLAIRIDRDRFSEPDAGDFEMIFSKLCVR